MQATYGFVVVKRSFIREIVFRLIGPQFSFADQVWVF